MCKSEELSVSQTGHTGIRVATEMNSPYKQLTGKRHSLTKEAQRQDSKHLFASIFGNHCILTILQPKLEESKNATYWKPSKKTTMKYSAKDQVLTKLQLKKKKNCGHCFPMNIQQVFSIIYHLFTYDWAHLYIIKSQMFSFLKASTLSWNLFQIRIPLNFGLRKMMENPQEQEVNCLKKKVNCLFKTGRRNKPVTLWTGSLIDPNSCWDPKTCWSQNLLIPKLVAAMSENNVDKHMFLKDSFFYFSFVTANLHKSCKNNTKNILSPIWIKRINITPSFKYFPMYISALPPHNHSAATKIRPRMLTLV